jgi:oligosaccharide repeat unit polymerase
MSNRTTNGAPIALLIVSLMIGTYSSSQVFLGGAGDWVGEVSFLALTWWATYLVAAYLYYKTIYLFSFAYLLPLALFHLGITIPDAFGLFEGLGWGNGSMSEWFEVSGHYTNIAFAFIGVGIAISMMTGKSKRARANRQPYGYRSSMSVVYYDGLWLLFVSMLMLILAVATLGNLLNYNRVDFFRGAGDTRGLGVFLMAFPSCLVLLFIGAITKPQKYFAYTVCFLGALLLLLSGYRASIMFPAMIAAVLWVKVGRRIPLAVAVAGVFAVAIIIPASGLLRSTGSYSEISIERIKGSVEESTFQETFRTLGQTGGAAAHVYRLVPDIDSHRWGKTYLDALTNAIPNILPQVGVNKRAEVKGALDRYDAINDAIPSDWLTYRIAKDKFDRGEGVGFSGIAEPYLNFGWIGVVLYFLFFGWLIGKIDKWDLGIKPNAIFFAAAMYWPLMRSVRNDFATFVKPAIFLLLLVCIWRLICVAYPAIRKGYLKARFYEKKTALLNEKQ